MDIKIHDEIGGFWGGVSARDVLAQLGAVPDGEAINVSIHSPGGDMMDGLAIYNALKMHASRVIVTVEGMAASAASLIAMAGDEVRIPENAYMMIHNPWGYVAGESKDFEEAADLFKQFEVTSAKVYARRTGKTVEEIKELQDASTWLDGAQAVEMGFADVMTDAVQIAAFAKMPKCMAENCPVSFSEIEPEPSELELEVEPVEPVEPSAPVEPAASDEPAEPVETEELEGAEPVEPEAPAEPVADPMAVAAEIVELCQLAGQVARAAVWIREGKTAEEVRGQLAKMALDGSVPASMTTAPDANAELLEVAKSNLTVRSLLAKGKIEEAITHVKNNKEK